MLDLTEVLREIGKWGGTLHFFPSDDDARLGIAEEITAMAETQDQVRWLVGRVPKLHSDWPAMREVRAVFCSRYKPHDGYDVCSAVYLDGIPPDPALERLRLTAGPAMRQLTGDVAASPKVESIFAVLAEARARKSAPAVDPAETERIKARQASQRNPDAVAELARKLGMK